MLHALHICQSCVVLIKNKADWPYKYNLWRRTLCKLCRKGIYKCDCRTRVTTTDGMSTTTRRCVSRTTKLPGHAARAHRLTPLPRRSTSHNNAQVGQLTPLSCLTLRLGPEELCPVIPGCRKVPKHETFTVTVCKPHVPSCCRANARQEHQGPHTPDGQKPLPAPLGNVLHSM
jgi:hypothetical protein